jgi:hypothetical protein
VARSALGAKLNSPIAAAVLLLKRPPLPMIMKTKEEPDKKHRRGPRARRASGVRRRTQLDS